MITSTKYWGESKCYCFTILQGKESSGESGVAKKPIKYWDPTAAPTTTMDYNSITDEEELNKLVRIELSTFLK